MGQTLEILSMPWKEREAAIKGISGTKPISIWSPEDFKAKFQGEIVEIKRGLNQYAPHFAIWALDKYGPYSKYGKTYRTEVINGKQKQVENPVIYDYDPTATDDPTPGPSLEMSQPVFAQEPKRRGSKN